MLPLGFFNRRGQVHHRIGDPLNFARGVSVKSTRLLAKRHFGWCWERFRIKAGGPMLARKDTMPSRRTKFLSRSRYIINLSDDATEFQIPGHRSFGRFLCLHINSKVQDANAIAIQRFAKTSTNKPALVEESCAAFATRLGINGFTAIKSQIVDESGLG